MSHFQIGMRVNNILLLLLLSLMGIFDASCQLVDRDLVVESGDSLVDRIYYNRYHSNNTRYLVWLLVLIPVFICIPCLIWVWCSDHCFQILKYRSNMKAVKEKKMLNEIIMSSLNENILNKELSNSNTRGSTPSTAHTSTDGNQVTSMSSIPPVHQNHSSSFIPQYQQPSINFLPTMEMSFAPGGVSIPPHPTYIQSSPSYIPGYHSHSSQNHIQNYISDGNNCVSQLAHTCDSSSPTHLFGDEIINTCSGCKCAGISNSGNNNNHIYTESCSCNRVDIPL